MEKLMNYQEYLPEQFVQKCLAKDSFDLEQACMECIEALFDNFSSHLLRTKYVGSVYVCNEHDFAPQFEEYMLDVVLPELGFSKSDYTREAREAMVDAIRLGLLRQYRQHFYAGQYGQLGMKDGSIFLWIKRETTYASESCYRNAVAVLDDLS
jgi:hypothetical protein